MKAEIETIKAVKLTLTEGEAQWLKAKMQNSPIASVKIEDGVDASIRARLFNTLKDSGI